MKKKIITDKNVYYIGGKFGDRYYLLFDNNEVALEVSPSDYNKYQTGEEYSLNEHQEKKLYKI